jgi:microcystin-dependent protein
MYYQTDFNFPGNSTNTPPPSTDLGSIFQRSLPIGTILMYGGTTLPQNYLWCDGSSISTTTYSTLYSAIGTSYGSSSGMFNVPNMGRSIPIGSNPNNAIGITYQNQYPKVTGGTIVMQANQLAEHYHLPPKSTFDPLPNIAYAAYTNDTNPKMATSNGGALVNFNNYNKEAVTTTGGIEGFNGPQEYLPPFTAVNFIIKYI